MTEPGALTTPDQPLFDLLEAVEYAARHDGKAVVIRDGKVVMVDRPASSNN